jgi:HK97 gp10 family phage protein
VIKGSIRIDWNHLPRMAKAIRSSVESEAKAEAEELAAVAREEAPVDTGALRDSIRAIPQGDKTHLVEVGMFYGVFVNNGTRKMPANPFWDRARKRVEGKHTDRHVKAVKRAVG